MQWQCPDNSRDSQRLWRDIWLNMFIIHSFYLAPFSALQQTHCVHVKCDSEWVTASFYSAFYFYNHGSGVLIALFGFCIAGATWNCCRLGASAVYTIQPSTSLQCLTPSCLRRGTGGDRDPRRKGKWETLSLSLSLYIYIYIPNTTLSPTRMTPAWR